VSDYRRLSSWLTEAGGRHDALEIRELRGMRGVVAARAIAADDPLVEIPRDRLINAATALDRLAQRQMRTGVEHAAEVTQLAAWLLVEARDPGSSFQPYLETLPRELRQFPILAAPEEVALLDGSLTGAMLEYQRAELKAEHARLAGEAPWFGAIGFDEYVWARMCVMSRTFKLTIDGVEGRVLVPFIDMLNHERAANTRWQYDGDGRVFRLIAQRAYRPGEEVCCSYGPKPNLYLLLNYGFCVENNHLDEAVIGASEQFRVMRDSSEPFAQLMLAQLRARCRDEATARIVLANAAHAGLARFSTTLAEDEALLAGDGLSPVARNFVIARLGEKRVLHAWLDLAASGPAALFA
jgi:histone-lysine N-methyltransferase SETD3